jgi:hypothetical protein
MRNIIAIPIIAGLVGMAALAAPLAAQARTTDTPVSFTLGAGLLTLTEPAAATLPDVTLGAADATGSLGTVTVADDTGTGGSWTATAVSSAFVGTVSADSIPATDVSYAAGAISGDTTVGSFTPTAGSITIGTSKTVVTAADVTGAASVNWTPTISIALPSGLVADVYDGEITDSVA